MAVDTKDDETFATIRAYLILIAFSLFGWAMFTVLTGVFLVGVATLLDVLGGYFLADIPIPKYWIVVWIVAGGIGAFELYTIVRENYDT